MDSATTTQAIITVANEVGRLADFFGYAVFIGVLGLAIRFGFSIFAPRSTVGTVIYPKDRRRNRYRL